MINFRRSVYLTIMNSLTYEEAVHKLLRLQVQEGMEVRADLSPVVESVDQVLTSGLSLPLYTDRALQHGHRVLFAGAILLELLRAHRGEILQD